MTVWEKLKDSPEAVARELAEAQMNGTIYAIECLEEWIFGETCLFREDQEEYLKSLFNLRRRAARLRLEYDVKEWQETLRGEEE